MSPSEPVDEAARHRRISDLFLEVCELDTAARSTLLDLRCGADGGLRAAVELLVARDREADGQRILSTAAGGAARKAAPAAREPDSAAALVGSRVGSYRLVRLLGSGGMGTVYEAEQDNPRRSVALKLMRPGVLGRESLKRFESESRLMARLRHPGIAQVFEAGTHLPPGAPPGSLPEPFFAMEYVEHARNLSEYCADHQLPVRARLELFAGVCDAVHHGHSRGVIHRDLKPGNVLVDGAGQSKIIDFGIARATDADIAAATLNTAVGQFIGTLNYMSPEQCEGDPDALDTRSDVYALGVVLYELLALRLPYDLGTRSLVEAPRIIREQPPIPLSTIDRTLRGDIETIVLKALEKDRERRFTSAAELAADIRRFLRHEPIAARRASRLYHLRMFTRRHTGLVLGLVVAFVALSLGLAAALVQTSRALTAESQARAALAESQLQDYIANIAAADGALRADDGGTALACLATAPEALRGWEWRHLLARADRSVRTLRMPDHPPTGFAISPDERQMLVYQDPRSMSLVDMASGTTLWSRADAFGFLRPFSRDGRFLTAHVGRVIVIVDALTGRDVVSFPAGDGTTNPMSTSFHPDGRRVAVAQNRGRLEVWDWRDARRTLVVPTDSWMWDIDFSPDGSALAYGATSAVRLVNPDSGLLIREFPVPAEVQTEETRAIRFSPDGSLLAVSHGTLIQLWDVVSGQLRTTIRTHTQRIFSLVFDASGTEIASVSADRTLRLWDVARGQPLDTLLGHADVVTNVDFCSAGKQLVTSAQDQTIKFWDVPAPSPIRSAATPGGVPWFLGFTSDGRQLVCGAGAIGSVLDGATLEPLRTIRSGPVAEPSGHFALSPDRRFLAAADIDDDTLALYDVGSGERVWSVGVTYRCEALDFSLDGKQLASSMLVEIGIFDAASGTLVHTIHTANQYIFCLRYEPGSNAMATVAVDGPVQLWDAASGALLRTLAEQDFGALSLDFSRDGSLMAVGTDQGTVGIWDTSSWRRVALLPGMQPEVWSLGFSPDGARLAAGSKSGAVHVWDTGTWHDLLQLRGHVGTVRSLVWSPDGSVLASGAHDHSLTLWDAPASPPANLSGFAPTAVH